MIKYKNSRGEKLVAADNTDGTYDYNDTLENNGNIVQSSTILSALANKQQTVHIPDDTQFSADGTAGDAPSTTQPTLLVNAVTTANNKKTALANAYKTTAAKYRGQGPIVVENNVVKDINTYPVPPINILSLQYIGIQTSENVYRNTDPGGNIYIDVEMPGVTALTANQKLKIFFPYGVWGYGTLAANRSVRLRINNTLNATMSMSTPADFRGLNAGTGARVAGCSVVPKTAGSMDSTKTVPTTLQDKILLNIGSEQLPVYTYGPIWCVISPKTYLEFVVRSSTSLHLLPGQLMCSLSFSLITTHTGTQKMGYARHYSDSISESLMNYPYRDYNTATVTACRFGRPVLIGNDGVLVEHIMAKGTLSNAANAFYFNGGSQYSGVLNDRPSVIYLTGSDYDFVRHDWYGAGCSSLQVYNRWML